ncbi:MAG: elongation factor G [Rubripirellula sp.]|nr:elongation factor G [Rubripirellula sp.]
MSRSSEWRNLAICGHASAGKTTLVDRLLAEAGAVPGTPSVADQTSVCDFDEEEKAHGHSIESAVVHLRHGQSNFNFIDTPGYSDFIGGMIGAMAAVDCAVICINAHAGIQLNTRRAMEEAQHAGIPRMIVVTKMDDPQADYKVILQECRDTWGNEVVPLQVPLGEGSSLTDVACTIDLPNEARDAAMNLVHAHEQLVEKLVESDETLMEQYFEGVMPGGDALRRLLKQSIAAGNVIPVLCTSANTGVGLTPLLDTLVDVAPVPEEIVRQLPSAAGETVTINQAADGPVIARVFKVRVDPFVQKLSYIRIFSGTLRKDQSVHVSGVRKEVKLHPLLRVQGEQTKSIDSASAGEIVAVAKMEDLHVGSSLGDLELPPIAFPEPMVGLAISPKKRGDENKLSASMHKLTEEDPTLKLSRDPQTSEMVMMGTSELHLQILRERLLRRDKIEVATHEPRIPYRETITQAAEGSYRHKKQSGGRGQFGEVHIRMLPLPRGTEIESFATKDRFPAMKSSHYHAKSNFLWVDSVVGGVIPGNLMPAIEKGFLARLSGGVIAGYPIQDVAVEVFFGKHHPVDSSEAAFKMAGSLVFREVFQQARPALLEPVVHMVVTTPETHVGDIFSDLSGRGGRVLSSDAVGGGMQSIECEVPLRAVGHYSRTLSSMTAGQGSYTLSFSHYETVSCEIQKKLMDAATNQEEEFSM